LPDIQQVVSRVNAYPRGPEPALLICRNPRPAAL